MRLRFRLFKMILAALCRKMNFNTTDESILRFTVMPWDCDVKLVSNDRYHAFMDLGRIDLVIRFGWWKIILKNKWEPFVKIAYIRYRYPLKMFQRFVLRTRLINWDDEYFWMEHLFERKGRTVAVAISKNSAKSKKGIVTPGEALHLLNRHLQYPVCHPEKVRLINDTEALLRSLQSDDPGLFITHNKKTDDQLPACN